MNRQNGKSKENLEVSDNEDYTDKKVKQRILNAREQLNEVQNELYSARLVEPDVDYSELDALMAWGNLVRSFIRDLSVLLNHDEVENADYYRDKVELGEVVLVPQDTQEVPFTKLQFDQYDGDYFRRKYGFSKGAELPEPERVKFTGLMDLVGRDNFVEKRWVVVKNPNLPKPEQDIVETGDRQPIPKGVYERALMACDQFLQGVGVGLDLSEDGMPDFGFEEVEDEY